MRTLEVWSAPVEALPKKPQPAAQRVGADVSGGDWLDSMDA